MKYVLLFCGTDADQAAYDALSSQEIGRRLAEVGHWFGENEPKLGAKNRLQPRDTATTVHFGEDGRAVVRDGPFMEGKELIGGYCEIDVADLDEALVLAKTWPGRGAVEIRPVLEMAGSPPS